MLLYTHALMCTHAWSSTVLCMYCVLCFSCCVPRSQSHSREPLNILNSMSDEQWEWFGRYSNIPVSELRRIRRQDSSERERKRAVIHSLASTHPALSWTRVAHALYWAANDKCSQSTGASAAAVSHRYDTTHIYTMFIVHIVVYLTCTCTYIYTCIGGEDVFTMYMLCMCTCHV